MSTSPSFFDRTIMKRFGGTPEQLQQGKSSVKDFFLGTPQRFEQLPTGTPGQQDLMSQLIGALSGAGGGQGPLGQGLGSGLTNLQQILGGSPEAFKSFEAPAMRQFQQEIIPGIAEQFTGADAQESSGFRQALGSAGAGLSERLAGQRSGLQSQALQQLMGLLGTSQQPQFQTTNIAAQPGFLQSLLSALGGIGGQALSGGIGGLIGGQGFRSGAAQGLGVR